MANKKTFDTFNDVDVRIHNDVMSMYASDEQLAALRDAEVRQATPTEIEMAKIRRCKLY